MKKFISLVICCLLSTTLFAQPFGHSASFKSIPEGRFYIYMDGVQQNKKSANSLTINNIPSGIHQITVILDRKGRPQSFYQIRMNDRDLFFDIEITGDPRIQYAINFKPTAPFKFPVEIVKDYLRNNHSTFVAPPQNNYQQPGYQPQQPGQPGHQPQQPGQPGHQPQQPGQPGHQPQQPGQPHQPGQPGHQPQQPGQPGHQPQQPGQPGHQPGQPQQPGHHNDYGHQGHGNHQPEVAPAEPVILPCPEPEFVQMKQAIKRENFSSDKMRVAKQAIPGHNLTVAQIKDLALLFSFDSDRLELLKFAYQHCFDPQNYYMVYEVLTYSSSKDELDKYISGIRF